MRDREFKNKTNYKALHKGNPVIVWKSTSGKWTDYNDPLKTYEEKDLVIGDELPDERK